MYLDTWNHICILLFRRVVTGKILTGSRFLLQALENNISKSFFYDKNIKKVK